MSGNEAYEAILNCDYCNKEYTTTINSDEYREYCDDCLENAPLWAGRCWDCGNSGLMSWRETQESENCPKCGSKKIFIDEVG